MKKILSEEIKYNVAKIRGGKRMAWIYGTNKESNDLIYNNRDILKKHGAQFNSTTKKWVWWLSDDDEKVMSCVRTYIYPCIKELSFIEHGEEKESDINTKIDSLIDLLNKILSAPVSQDDLNNPDVEPVDIKAIKARVASFKDKLVAITSSEEFKTMLGPIIKFKQALGPSFSLGNVILIYLQDPNATMVKSRTKWKYSNREVVKGAKPIALYLPHGKPKYPTKESRNIVINNFLKERDVKNINELTPGERETLDNELNSFKSITHYTLEPNWFDHRFTKPIEGKEDLAPKSNMDNIEWFDGTTPETEKTAELYDAVLEVIKKTSIKVNFVKDLGGARGVSKGGVIDVLEGEPKNIGSVNTLIHEFSHELLHHKYLAMSSDEDFGRFFVGRKDGRAMVEQQAELSAWIVTSYFGFNMNTSINYMGCWGIDEKKAPKVFDTVAEVASFIIKEISSYMKRSIKESVDNSAPISGLDVANMVGLGNLYLKNKKKIKKITESYIRNMVHTIIKEELNKKK